MIKYVTLNLYPVMITICSYTLCVCIEVTWPQRSAAVTGELMAPCRAVLLCQRVQKDQIQKLFVVM